VTSRRVAAGVAVLACAGAMAQAGDPAERRALEQKEALVRRLAFDSPAESRIAAGDSEEARTELRRARAFHARALALAEAGELGQARKELDAALVAIARARQLAPDAAARSREQGERFATRLRAAEALARSYESNLALARGLPADAAAEDGRLVGARAGLEGARHLAAAGQAEQAAAALEGVERELMAGLNAALGSATLRYSRQFADPAEEYAFELARNRDYRDLVPVAIARLTPRREAVTLVERYVTRNARLVEAAAGHAAERRFAQAIDDLRSGTANLQSALAAAGLAMPRDNGAH